MREDRCQDSFSTFSNTVAKERLIFIAATICFGCCSFKATSENQKPLEDDGRHRDEKSFHLCIPVRFDQIYSSSIKLFCVRHIPPANQMVCLFPHHRGRERFLRIMLFIFGWRHEDLLQSCGLWLYSPRGKLLLNSIKYWSPLQGKAHVHRSAAGEDYAQNL